MFVNIEDFIQELSILRQELLAASKIEIAYKRIDKVSLRIIIKPAIFIDIYANIETTRYDFSLIKDNKRIFGYDNLGGWHYHPLNKLDEHVKCKEPSLKFVLKEMSAVIKAL